MTVAIKTGKYFKELGHKKALYIADNFICMDKEHIEGFQWLSAIFYPPGCAVRSMPRYHFYDSHPFLLMFYLFITNYFRNVFSQSYTFHNYLLASVVPKLGTIQTQRIISGFSPFLIRIKIVIRHTPFICICHHFDSFLFFYII